MLLILIHYIAYLTVRMLKWEILSNHIVYLTVFQIMKLIRISSI